MKSSRIICKHLRCGSRPTNSSAVGLTVLFVCLLTVAHVEAAVTRTAFVTTKLPCKYSVRDVAFVNVHGKSWQLQMIKPADVDPQTFKNWNETLKTKLDNSNVGYVWYDTDSSDASTLREHSTHANLQPKTLPKLFLTGPSDQTFEVLDRDSSLTFSQRIDELLESPIRQKILQRLVDSLCVVLLIEAENPLDSSARDTVEAAVEQVNKQMWTMEKPTDNGPVMIRVPASEIANETWLLNSLEINVDERPAVAIVYGQGRRLGEVLTGDDIAIDKIVGRASVCGSDCECDLNRDWLYGQQMIHVWSQELERKAEGSLSFDPNSAFVAAEVAQIIQKNSSRLPTDNRINLGGGLVIHDLDQIENAAVSQNTGLDTADSHVADSSLSDNHSTDSLPVKSDVSESPRSSPSYERESPAPIRRDDLDSQHDSAAESETQGLKVPWTIIAGLLFSLLVVSSLLIQKSKRQQ